MSRTPGTLAFAAVTALLVTQCGLASLAGQPVRSQEADGPSAVPAPGGGATPWAIPVFVLRRGDVDVLVSTARETPSAAVATTALLVVAGSDDGRRALMLADLARSEHPGLRAAAVEVQVLLGQRPDAETVMAAYRRAGHDARRRLLNALDSAGDRCALVAIARTEDDPGLREDAIHRLGVMGAAGANAVGCGPGR